MRYPPDRATVATTAILQIIATAPKQELQQAIEDYLRDEFADVTRQVMADMSYGARE
jgi:hypothetical protein